MNLENYIPLNQLCLSYKVEMSFFTRLNEYDLIEIISIEKSQFIHKDKARDIEKIIRMHQELEINFEGIETIFNLLEKINTLQEELVATKNKLKMYED
ncbi:MAG: MerR family transcriptional regulator [Bacteroidetes bacterium]|nr:MAG: MerR family transcriptional regulator [Bacteroidota bacterium]MBL1144596.1 MerR family transcriptional regulator [Bacteroidota bacterium]MCB0802257.1 MerR family transcriptional regulator [Flavobacteriales bacterium]NOG57391.1 MerR family transcriptional regulator [Bacteroidota bacterium]